MCYTDNTTIIAGVLDITDIKYLHILVKRTSQHHVIIHFQITNIIIMSLTLQHTLVIANPIIIVHPLIIKQYLPILQPSYHHIFIHLFKTTNLIAKCVFDFLYFLIDQVQNLDLAITITNCHPIFIKPFNT